MAARHEITVDRIQSKVIDFKPLRLILPYGKWICEDGTEVLFNRDYCPIWAKRPKGKIIPLQPDTWVEYMGNAQYYFNDGTAPWNNNKTKIAECMSVLKDWGVDNKQSVLQGLFAQAIKSGNMDLLKPKNLEKNTW